MYFRYIFILVIWCGASSAILQGMESNLSCLPLRCTESSANLDKKFARINVGTLEYVLHRLFNENEKLHTSLYRAAVYNMPIKKGTLQKSSLPDEDIAVLCDLFTDEGKLKPQCEKLVTYFCTIDWLKKALTHMYIKEPLALTQFIRSVEYRENIKHSVLSILLKIMPVDLDETFLIRKEFSFYIANKYINDIYTFVKESYPQECNT